MIYVEGDCCTDFVHYPAIPEHFAKRDSAIPDTLKTFPDCARLGASDAMLEDRSLNCQFFPGKESKSWKGGAHLTAMFIKAALQAQKIEVHFPCGLNGDCHSTIDSHVYLDLFQRDPEDKAHKPKQVWRVREHGGYTTSRDKSCARSDQQGRAAAIKFSHLAAGDLLVLDDAGNGFRNQAKLADDVDDVMGRGVDVLVKLSRPLSTATYMTEILRTVGRQNRPQTAEFDQQQASVRRSGLLVVAMDMRDLRAEGMAVSRGLSWERTATNFVATIFDDQRCALLKKADYLVVRTDLEGAIVCNVSKARGNAPKDREEAFVLVYDAAIVEGDINEQVSGRMVGFSSAFAAQIAVAMASGSKAGMSADLMAHLIEGTRAGLVDARRLLIEGFGESSAEPREPCPLPLPDPKSLLDMVKRPLFHVKIRPSAIARGIGEISPVSGQPAGWQILSELDSVNIALIAESIVTHGMKPEGYGVPIGQFGAIQVADRFEAEGYRAIRELMREYCRVPSPSQPLCVAVFGQPGSGKSFGVKQVAKAVFGKDPTTLTFNLSEFTNLNELTRAFHLVNDKTKGGVVPLVFFDEFDSALGSEGLGWLKYFLAPMQDGEFRDGADVHPIGKSIFVFAGGTRHSFADFSLRTKKEDTDEFIERKGPDFLSRLRGYVNVAGPDYRFPSDFGAMIRRSMVLRYNLDQRQKSLGLSPAQHLRRRSGCDVAVDPFVLKALLRVPTFKHGMRSIAAIVEMSRLSVVHGLEPAALPSAVQMELHVDSRFFSALLDAYRILFGRFPGRSPNEVWMDMAKKAHHYYAIGQYTVEAKSAKQESDVSLWSHCHPKGTGAPQRPYWDSNVRQVAEIPHRIVSLGYQLLERHESSPDADEANGDRSRMSFVEGFTPGELVWLAREEHRRWIAEKESQGWRYSPVRDDYARLHHLLIDWDVLPPSEQRKDIDAVASIPELLRRDGLALLDTRTPRPPASTVEQETRASSDDRDSAKKDDGAPRSPPVHVRAFVFDGGRTKVLTVARDGQRDLPGCRVDESQRIDVALSKEVNDLPVFKERGIVPDEWRFAGSSMPAEDAIWLFYELSQQDSIELVPDDGTGSAWLLCEKATDIKGLPDPVVEFLERWIPAMEYQKQHGK